MPGGIDVKLETRLGSCPSREFRKCSKNKNAKEEDASTPTSDKATEKDETAKLVKLDPTEILGIFAHSGKTSPEVKEDESTKVENEVKSSDTGEREKSPVVTDDNSACAEGVTIFQNEETEKQEVNSIQPEKKIPMYPSLQKVENQPECSNQEASSVKQEEGMNGRIHLNNGSKSFGVKLKGKHNAEGQKDEFNPPKRSKIELETTAANKIRQEIFTLIDIMKRGGNKIKEAEKTVTDVKATLKDVEKRLEGLLECPELAMIFQSSVPAPENLPDEANHMTGLRNERGHCYLNTSVQIIANIKKIWTYFISEEYYEHLIDGLQSPVAPVFADLLLRLKSDLVQKVNPKNFIRVLGAQLTFVDSDTGSDSCMLLTELLRLLSKELRNRAPTTEQGIGDVQNFYLQKKKKNPSIIFELFTGVASFIEKCIHCGIKRKWLDIVDFLTLDIPDHGPFSLEDCIKLNFEVKIIDSRCQKCNCLELETLFRLAIIPEFVIIRINNATLNHEQCLESQRHLVLSENMLIPEFKEEKFEEINYRLKAIAFSDRSKPIWHAFAGVVNRNYYTLYNDEIVSEISFDEVLNLIWDYLVFERISKKM